MGRADSFSIASRHMQARFPTTYPVPQSPSCPPGERRFTVRQFGVAANLLVPGADDDQCGDREGTLRSHDPFRIAGNLYYVGATGDAACLLTGPEGHVLIDGGYPETAAPIQSSIRELLRCQQQ